MMLRSGDAGRPMNVVVSHCGLNAAKKNARSRAIGPPISKPASLTLVAVVCAAICVRFGRLTAVYSPSSASGRNEAKTLPVNRLLPLLVTTLTTPPVAWPYSAS
jgi:hypothetical protein